MLKDKAFIIEDHEDTAHLLDHLIRAAGYQCFVFSNYASALASVMRDSPCIVFADINVDGEMKLEEFIRKAREVHPDLTLALISADSKIDEYAKRVGADAAIMKPFDLHQIESAVAKHCPKLSIKKP